MTNPLRDRTITVLRPDSTGAFAVHAVARPGQPWRSGSPFPLTIDPAAVFPA